MDRLWTNPERALGLFEKCASADIGELGDDGRSWLFTDRKLSRGQLRDMNFYGFAGAEHLSKYFGYIKGYKYPDFLNVGRVRPLQRQSQERDLGVFDSLGLPHDNSAVKNIALYNAQDYAFQRSYATPARQSITRMLDFGAGHGRMANLAFGAQDSTVKKYFAIDGIPASYLTQNMYYNALGLRVYDYIEQQDREFDLAEMEPNYDAFHFPTWKMSLLPSNYFDLVCCVQVLREISQPLLFYVLQQFQRVLKPGGALYVRDHIVAHNPNQMPQDSLLENFGFQIEYYPRVSDYAEVHGVPRIWRKSDPQILLASVAPHAQASQPKTPEPVLKPKEAKILVHQFWDKEPPEEVAVLMQSWRDDPNIHYVSYDETQARKFIQEKLDKRALAAFDQCAVPAMKADFFRYCVLFVEGGIYIDADTQNLGGIEGLYTQAERGLLFMRHGKVANDFMVVKKAGDALMRYAIDAAIENIEAKASNNVWEVTGPGILTELYQSSDSDDKPEFKGFTILGVREVRKIVGFRWDLDYKSTSAHWANAPADGSKSIYSA